MFSLKDMSQGQMKDFQRKKVGFLFLMVSKRENHKLTVKLQEN